MDYATQEMMGASAVAAVLLTAVLPLIILLIAGVINGIFCKKLAAHKGYKGYFWTGFFFGWLGLIYVHGLPDLNLRKDLRAVMKRLVSNDDRITRLEDQQFSKQY